MNKKGKLFNLNSVIIFLVILITIFLIIFLFKSQNISFIIKNDNIEIKIGETRKIEYEINTNEKINWKSSNSDIVGVDDNGILKAKRQGQVIITGTIFSNYKTCKVTVYSGEKDIPLEEIDVLDGDLYMMPNSEMIEPFTVYPSNAYVNSIDYNISNPNVIEVIDNKIISKNEGESKLTIIVNNSITKTINVYVSSSITENKIVRPLNSIKLNEDNVILQINESKKLSFTSDPKEAIIKKVEWSSSDDSIVSVIDGILKANKPGKATIKLVVNNYIYDEIMVTVLEEVKEIIVDHYPKKVLKTGETTNIIVHTSPVDVTKSLMYESSNSNVASINNGIITGLQSGKTTITVSFNNGVKYSTDIEVFPTKGIVTDVSNFWGYNSLNAKIPVLAGIDFFKKLAINGKGTLQGDKYVYGKYTYNISSNLLQTDGKNVLVRIYYPPNEDLSNLSIFAYMGGDGENNFNGLFGEAKGNPTVIKSAGISVLIAERNGSFTQYDGIAAYQFVQSIIDQKSGIKNSIAGFSTGGTKVFWVADECNIDRVVVFSSYFQWPSYTKNLYNKEIMVYIPSGDHLFSQASTLLDDLKRYGYSNVTLVTNNINLANKHANNFLVINPGSLMKSGHLTENVKMAGLFEYIND